MRLGFVDVGRGPPVVLLHGFMSDCVAAWIRRGVAERLAQDHRVLALDCRGHGSSDKPHEPSAYGPEMAWDVTRLLDHLGLDRAHVVGYSMGAHIAVQLLTLAPARFLTAVLGGAAGRIGWSDEDERLALLESGELERGSLRSQLLRLKPPDKPTPSNRTLRARSRAALRGQDRAALAAVRRSNRDQVVTEAQLRTVHVPVLGIVGSLDPYLAVFRRVQRVLPRMQLCVVAGGTHRTTAGSPAFLELLVRFLAAHPPPTG